MGSVSRMGGRAVPLRALVLALVALRLADNVPQQPIPQPQRACLSECTEDTHAGRGEE